MLLELHILRNRSRREALDWLGQCERAELSMYARALGLALHKASRNAYIAAIVAATHPLPASPATDVHQAVQEPLL